MDSTAHPDQTDAHTDQNGSHREKRIVYTKGMAAACRLILEDARLPQAVRGDIEERLAAYTALIADLEEVHAA